MSTLLLDTVIWDLVADSQGNIAMADEPYAFAQDAASEIRLFQGDCYYDVDRGIPYFASILGKFPPLQLVRSKLEKAALLVTGLVKAKCFIDTFENRKIAGRVQVTDKSGNDVTVGF